MAARPPPAGGAADGPPGRNPGAHDEPVDQDPTREGCVILAEDRLALRRQTFEGLYRRYFWGLVGFCRGSLKSRAAAEDAAQEAFLRAYKYLHTLDPQRSAWPWLKAIARNVLADRAGREREIPLATAEDWYGPDDQVSAEDRMILRGAMASLPNRHRLALHLRYVEGWDPSAAAAFLQLSVPAFNQLVFRARARFREELAKLGQAVPAAIAAPFQWLRARMYRMASRSASADGSVAVSRSTEALLQLAGGVVAFLIVTGAPSAPATERTPHPTGVEVVASAPVVLERHPRPKVVRVAKVIRAVKASATGEGGKAKDGNPVTEVLRKVGTANPKGRPNARISLDAPKRTLGHAVDKVICAVSMCNGGPSIPNLPLPGSP